MKLFVMCCVVLSLAVCSVEQAEGYDVGLAGCVMDCDEYYDLCTTYHVPSDLDDCLDRYLKCTGNC